MGLEPFQVEMGLWFPHPFASSAQQVVETRTLWWGGRVYKPRLERVEKDQVLAVGGIHTLAPGAPLHQKLVMTWRLQTLQSRPFAHLPRLRKQREGHESCPITGGKERGCRCCCRKRHGDSSKRRSTVPV